MRKRTLSGMQPSGRLHLGNYMGALANWVKFQDSYDAYFFVADWHALSTNYENTAPIRDYCREMLVDWMAAGLDPERCVIFQQSRVPEHAVLHVLFSMITPLAWLERNPTYKDQQANIADRDLTTYGFLGYPVLQAADILIYKPQAVPVGVDQLPHVELTREIARRFNHLYREVFPIPETPLTEAPKLPGLDGRKMSKSYGNAVFLSDSPAQRWDKVRTMVTDPARVRRTDPGNPDVCPVFDLHKVFSDRATRDEMAAGCRGAGIGCIDCKKRLNAFLDITFTPIHERRQAIARDNAAVEAVLIEGSRRAQQVARATLDEVYDAMGIVPFGN
ncbi:MAG: tryptophan--tRNA ligase [Nitrospirae bacterium]|nr:tryptophan--tRNA ligase [Nitrospirota bacterium]